MVMWQVLGLPRVLTYWYLRERYRTRARILWAGGMPSHAIALPGVLAFLNPG